jgi:hypothetical protein
MSAKGRNLLRIGLAAMFLAATALACSPIPAASAVSVVIASPSDGGTVVVGQAVMIDSAVTAAAGVDRVDLSVDGQVVRHDTPPEGNPTEFRVSQLWTPTSEGRATITVAAYDVNEASDEATITLQVVASGGVVPTGIPGSTAVATESTEAPPPPVKTEAGCTLDSQFVTDVTIPDGTMMSPNAAFVKTWQVRNSGTCDWEAGFQLVFVSGDQMGGPASVSLPAVAAGGETDVSTSLVAPNSYGTHKGTWRVRSNDGTMFGTNLTVVIDVNSPATEMPPLTVAWPGLDPQPTAVVIDPRLKLPFTERVTQEATLPAYGKKEIVAECPASTVVVGGGFSGTPRVVFGKNHKTAGNGWTVDAKNNSDSNETIRVYAVCLYNVSGASSEMVQVGETVESHGSQTVIARCPAGSILTGGGWSTHENVQIETSSFSGGWSDDNEYWSITAHNDTSTDYPLYAVATCLSGTGGNTRGYGTSTGVEAGSPGQVAHRCPADRIMTGGGFRGFQSHGGSFTIYISSGPWGTEPDAEWRVYGMNTGDARDSLSISCACLELP